MINISSSKYYLVNKLYLNTKYELLNPKQILNSNVLDPKHLHLHLFLSLYRRIEEKKLWSFVFCYLVLFRISDLEIRISQEFQSANNSPYAITNRVAE